MPLYRALYYSGCRYTGPPTVFNDLVQINLAFDLVRENSKYLNFEENLVMRWLSRLLKEVAHGRWWISRDCRGDAAMASFL